MDQQLQEQAETSGFVTLGTAIREVTGNLVAADQAPSQATAEELCPACNGFGWLRRDVPVADPHFGQSVECGVCRVVQRQYIARIFREADVPARFRDFSFATYPVADVTKDALAACQRWALDWDAPEDDDEADRDWNEVEVPWRKQGLFLWGPYGSGKTGLAVSTMRRHQEHTEEPALFIRVPDLLDSIRATYSPGSESSEDKVMAALRDLTLVVLDDIGAERPTDWVKEKLYTIIGHRHDAMLDTIFTSNLTLEALAEQIGERTVHRIAEMCRVIEVNGPNLRAG